MILWSRENAPEKNICDFLNFRDKIMKVFMRIFIQFLSKYSNTS